MTTLVYDNSFEGLLTAIFEVFEYQMNSPKIIAQQNYHNENIFAEIHHVQTEPEKAQRVLAKLEKTLGKSGISSLLKVFLAEVENSEFLIFYAIEKSLTQAEILKNYADEAVLNISKINKSMNREIHRMHAFVRFEKLQDEVYFAKIAPDFNVLPLILSHFKERYQDQKWMIFDFKRNYGAFYQQPTLDYFYPESDQFSSFKQSENFHHSEERNYQKLWQGYFFKTNIPERKNLKLHHQHVPKRYWKYLTEKI